MSQQTPWSAGGPVSATLLPGPRHSRTGFPETGMQ